MGLLDCSLVPDPAEFASLGVLWQRSGAQTCFCRCPGLSPLLQRSLAWAQSLRGLWLHNVFFLSSLFLIFFWVDRRQGLRWICEIKGTLASQSSCEEDWSGILTMDYSGLAHKSLSYLSPYIFLGSIALVHPNMDVCQTFLTTCEWCL